MSSPDRPFAQMSVFDVVDLLDVLSPVKTKILLTVAAFSADPIAPSIKDVCVYSHLSRPSVSTGLDEMCRSEILDCFVDGEGTRRYKTNAKYFRYPAVPVSIRTRVPGPRLNRPTGADADVKTAFTSTVVSSSIDSPLCEKHKLLTAVNDKTFAILSELSTPVEEPGLSKLARTISPELARAWFIEWLPRAPASFKHPLAFAVKRLMEDPQAKPPAARQERLPHWYDDYKEFVNR